MSSWDQLANVFALASFKLDAVIELLIQNGVIDKDEFRTLVFRKIDKGEDEAVKQKMKESLNGFLG